MRLSFPAKLTLGFGVVALAASFALTQLHTISYGNLDPAIAAIDRELRALDNATPEAATKATRSLDKLRRDLLTRESFAEWRASLSEGWAVNPVGEPEVKSVSLQRVAIARPQALKSDWPEIVRFVADLQTRPGFIIRSLTLTSSTNRTRNMGNVLIVGNAAFAPQP
jgi:hypothetical protein